MNRVMRTALGPGPWPYWSPNAQVADAFKPRGYPAVANYLSRASAELAAPGLGFAWTSVAGNRDRLRQGTALPDVEIAAIATGSAKTLRRPENLQPHDPLAFFVDQPVAFSRGMTREVAALASRAARWRTALPGTWLPTCKVVLRMATCG